MSALLQDPAMLGYARNIGAGFPDFPSDPEGVRLEALAGAFRAIRKFGLRTDAELFQFLQCGINSIGPANKQWEQGLVDLACDVEGPAHYGRDLSLRDFDKRGEYDSATQGVKDRSSNG